MPQGAVPSNVSQALCCSVHLRAYGTKDGWTWYRKYYHRAAHDQISRAFRREQPQNKATQDVYITVYSKALQWFCPSRVSRVLV